MTVPKTSLKSHIGFFTFFLFYSCCFSRRLERSPSFSLLRAAASRCPEVSPSIGLGTVRTPDLYGTPMRGAGTGWAPWPGLVQPVLKVVVVPKARAHAPPGWRERSGQVQQHLWVFSVRIMYSKSKFPEPYKAKGTESCQP